MGCVFICPIDVKKTLLGEVPYNAFQSLLKILPVFLVLECYPDLPYYLLLFRRGRTLLLNGSLGFEWIVCKFVGYGGC